MEEIIIKKISSCKKCPFCADRTFLDVKNHYCLQYFYYNGLWKKVDDVLPSWCPLLIKDTRWHCKITNVKEALCEE